MIDDTPVYITFSALERLSQRHRDSMAKSLSSRPIGGLTEYGDFVQNWICPVDRGFDDEVVKLMEQLQTAGVGRMFLHARRPDRRWESFRTNWPLREGPGTPTPPKLYRRGYTSYLDPRLIITFSLIHDRPVVIEYADPAKTEPTPC